MEKELKNLILVSTAVVFFLGVYLLVEFIFPFFKTSANLLLSALSPFILAIIISILIDPLVNYLEIKVRIGRSIAVVVSLFLVLGFLSVCIIFIISRMTVELMQFYSILPNISRYIIFEGSIILEVIRTFIYTNPLPPEVYQTLQENAVQFFNSLKIFLGRFTESLIIFLATLPLIFTIVIVSALATFFISKDKEKINNFIINLLPVKLILPATQVFDSISKALVGFLRAQFLLVSMTAVQTIIGLHIIGIEYAFTVGVITGIMDIIPILGPGGIFIPWAAWHLLVGDYKLGSALLILYIIVITIRQLIEPKLIGDSIGLHPLAVLFSIFVGLSLLGIKGLVAGPLVILIIKIIYQLKRGS
ncbi:MAG: sporulation integral membrane protein YtvI [Bacillota bacterium]